MREAYCSNAIKFDWNTQQWCRIMSSQLHISPPPYFIAAPLSVGCRTWEQQHWRKKWRTVVPTNFVKYCWFTKFWFCVSVSINLLILLLVPHSAKNIHMNENIVSEKKGETMSFKEICNIQGSGGAFILGNRVYCHYFRGTRERLIWFLGSREH